MSESERSGRRIKITLVPRDEKDDQSILDIVRVALEDGLRASAVSTTASTPKQSSEQPERHSPVGEKLESNAREAIEEALAKVIERFQASGQEPKFEPAKWNEQLSKVWAVVQKAKAAGVQLRVAPPEPPPPVEGT